jgi:hypothetical protein
VGGSYGTAVYKLWQGRFTEAWHQLSPQEQQRFLSLVMEALNTAGGKELVMCSAAWSNERWPFFGVEELWTAWWISVLVVFTGQTQIASTTELPDEPEQTCSARDR